jgi:hypothetical protein
VTATSGVLRFECPAVTDKRLILMTGHDRIDAA